MPIRTASMGLPRIYSDVLEQALDDPGELIFVSVDTSPLRGNASRLEEMVARDRPDAVLAGLEGVEDRIAIGRFAAEHCEVTIVAITTDGREAWLVHLRPDLVPVPEVSPNGLRDCIRAAVERRR